MTIPVRPRRNITASHIRAAAYALGLHLVHIGGGRWVLAEQHENVVISPDQETSGHS